MKHTVVIGGGMAGLAAAYRLSRMGVKVTLIESDAIGGLAASFEHEGRFMPRSYHHILSKDRTLVGMLRKLGIYRKVRWKHVKLVFWIGKRPYDLSNPADLLLLPLNLWDKTVLIQFLLRCFVRGRWREIHTDARSWLDSWANRRVREVMFEPMARIKFNVGTEQLSASWLGARLHAREGSSLFGAVPGVTRGNHYHKTTREFFYIIRGKIIVTVTNVKTNNTTRFTASPSDCFIIEPYENHTVEFLEDTEWIVLLSENFNAENPDIHKPQP